MKVLEGEGQADCIESQLLQAPDNSVKVLRQTVIALAQVPRSCQACIEAEPAPASPVRARTRFPICQWHTKGAGRIGSLLKKDFPRL